MRQTFVGLLSGFAILVVLATGLASAEEWSGSITAAAAVPAEDARYAARTANDFAAMETRFGPELVYSHSSAAVDKRPVPACSMLRRVSGQNAFPPNFAGARPPLRARHIPQLMR
jgi:hypothetical protein